MAEDTNMRPGKNGAGKLKSGNTKNITGPKTGKRLQTIINEMFEKMVDVDIDGTLHKMTAKEAIAFRLVLDSYNDEDPNIRLRAAKELFAHTDPIPKQIDITTDGEPIQEPRRTIEILFRDRPTENDGKEDGPTSGQ
jgi:hypothetical protein